LAILVEGNPDFDIIGGTGYHPPTFGPKNAQILVGHDRSPTPESSGGQRFRRRPDLGEWNGVGPAPKVLVGMLGVGMGLIF
jgi:hypothetical protein